MSALLGYNVLFCYVVVLFILYCFELLLCIDLHWFALICIDLHWFTLFCVVMLWVCVCAKPLMCVPRLWRECQIFEFVCVKALNLCVSRLWICVCQGFDVSAANEYAHVPCRQQWNVYVSCWQQWMCMCRVGGCTHSVKFDHYSFVRFQMMEISDELDQIETMWGWDVRKWPLGGWDMGPHVFRIEKDNRQI